MALSLNTAIDGQKFYSCNFPDLSISTSYGVADVTIVVNGSTALSTRYYAVNGIVNVRNLASLIELTMERIYRQYCTVSVTVAIANESVSASCEVLMCKSKCMSVDVETFITNSFLTTNLHRLVTVHGEDVLSFYIAGSGQYSVGTFKFNCILRKADGSVVTHEWVSGRRFQYGISNSAISISDTEYTCQLTYPGCKLLSFSITFNKRICYFYVIPCAAARTFRFTNVFGCQEAVSLPCATTNKLESDFSEAMVDGQLLHYDIKHTRTYQEQTAQLLSNHMAWLEQFLTSSSIMLRMGAYQYADVLIKEYTFEQTNAPGEENTLTFTWQFADGRQTTQSYTIHTGIFTEQYNEPFA